jgi:hypothetical protein
VGNEWFWEYITTSYMGRGIAGRWVSEYIKKFRDTGRDICIGSCPCLQLHMQQLVISKATLDSMYSGSTNDNQDLGYNIRVQIICQSSRHIEQYTCNAYFGSTSQYRVWLAVSVKSIYVSHLESLHHVVHLTSI